MLFHMEYIGQEVLKDISTSFLIHVSSLCLYLMLVHLKVLSEALSKTKKRVWRDVKGSGLDQRLSTIKLKELKQTCCPQSGIILFKSKFGAKTSKIGARILGSLSWLLESIILQSGITREDSVALCLTNTVSDSKVLVPTFVKQDGYSDSDIVRSNR